MTVSLLVVVSPDRTTLEQSAGDDGVGPDVHRGDAAQIPAPGVDGAAARRACLGADAAASVTVLGSVRHRLIYRSGAFRDRPG